ncbi:uncharacterized protein LOC128557671 [Mercenaria mercenaria]|uniref:uncharacterized protein LOC128557671 n=1 Tax=Mercenaria mercenaria TaxID=6596 RepID=UPI00234F1C41|nr:uncharacterized protein LOC128557671 [Mercenaria mercenaria]XP_053401546.1 uncharacterized protein LOC128557671 [Mercenaria mercenaria]
MWSGSYKRPTDDMAYKARAKRQKTGSERDERKRFIDGMYDRLSLDADDKKKSRAYVDKILGEIISHVRKQEDGNVYGHQIIKAGSYPINAKIGEADEFDTNILLNIKPKRVYCRGQAIFYMFMEVGNQSAHASSMSTDLKLVKTDDGEGIPDGYAVVRVHKSEIPTKFVHYAETSSRFLQTESATSPNFLSFPTTFSNVLYGGAHYQPNYFNPCSPASFLSSGEPSYFLPRELTDTVVINTHSDCIHIIPRDVKQDLHQRIKKARNELGLKEVNIKNTAQGPALTLTISPNRALGISHEISVDVTVSLKCSAKLDFEDFGWPRAKTREAFDEDVIDAAIEAGIHLVPKKDQFWSISYSRAERALLSSIDREFGCRKRVLKLLKKYVEKCKFCSTSKLPGISSHILKTQVLWSCEMHADDANDYWNYENRDICLMNTMMELENSLRRREIPEYFNESLNVLRGKDPSVLDELANYLNNELREIKHSNELRTF